ncbi:hypothetical protein Tco_0536889 [Tanacetum coccineum]
MDASKCRTIPMQPNVDLSSIMYVVRYTRPDVAFSQNVTSRYQQNPGESHWTAETNRDDLRSQTGYVFMMNGGAVDWKSSKQSTTAMSSTEAKYIATSEAAMEAIWIRKFIFGLGVVPYIEKPMDMYCDNTGAITIADEPGVLKDNNLAEPFTKPMPCTKHVEHAKSIRLRPTGYGVKELAFKGYTVKCSVDNHRGDLLFITWFLGWIVHRPDISYFVHCLIQPMHAPLKSHFDITLRVLKNIKLAPVLGVKFSKGKGVFDVTAYSDSD